MASPRILITGYSGQLGNELAFELRRRYGADNVVCSDVKLPPAEDLQNGPFEYLDVTNKDAFAALCVNQRIDWIVHFAALLSAIGEQNPGLLMDVNMRGTENALEISKRFGLRCFVPSSIGAFGPTTPREMTPDITVQKPNTIYGVSKVYSELLGEWYNSRFGVDFRSLRYPGIISWKTQPGGGTTDWSCAMYFDCLSSRSYECFVSKDTAMPLMYMPDCVKATADFLGADNTLLKHRTYNIHSLCFDPEEQAKDIRRHYPEFDVRFAPDFRQAIAESWPVSLDDSNARNDWGWSHDFDLSRMTDDIFDNLRKSHVV